MKIKFIVSFVVLALNYKIVFLELVVKSVDEFDSDPTFYSIHNIFPFLAPELKSNKSYALIYLVLLCGLPGRPGLHAPLRVALEPNKEQETALVIKLSVVSQSKINLSHTKNLTLFCMNYLRDYFIFQVSQCSLAFSIFLEFLS